MYKIDNGASHPSSDRTDKSDNSSSDKSNKDGGDDNLETQNKISKIDGLDKYEGNFEIPESFFEVPISGMFGGSNKHDKNSSSNVTNKSQELLKTFSKIYLGCEFTECILIIEEFLKAGKTHGFDIDEWCENYGFNFSGLSDVIAKRDEIITSFASLNLQLINNEIHLSDEVKLGLDKGASYIQKIKRCIHQGYNQYTVTLNTQTDKYISDLKGVEVDIESSLIKNIPDKLGNLHKPRRLIMSGINLQQDGRRPEDPYKFRCADLVSIL